MNKKGMLFLIVCLLFINSSYVFACQYTEIVSEEIFEDYYFQNDTLYGIGLNSSEIEGVENITHKKVQKTIETAVCIKCGNKTCLDDDTSCVNDKECGSGICNIAGFCGQEKVVNCPNGKLNCDDWTCLYPSNKSIGEGYSCEWECISGFGKEGVCKETNEKVMKDRTIFIVITLFVLAISLFLIIISNNKKIWDNKRKKESAKAKEKAKKEGKEIIKKSKKESAKAKEKAKKEGKEIIKKSKEELKRIENKLVIKNKQKKEIKEDLILLKNEKDKTKEEEKELINKKKELLEKNLEIEKLSEEEKNKQKKLDEEIRNSEIKRTTPFLNKQGYRVYLNEDGYEVFEDSGSPFHVWWFKHNHNRKIKKGYHIHHKDHNKRNNDIDNLEEKEPKEHYWEHKKRRFY
jgi:hypothetical protein